MLGQAQAYLKMGLSVVPIAAGHKATPEGVTWTDYQKQLPSEEQVSSWFTAWPDAGVGFVTGPISGRLVLDVDPDGFKDMEGRELPMTPTARTARGGLHYYFRWTDKLAGVVTTKQKLFGRPGVDVRGDGGMIVAPPTLGATGQRYTWLPGRDLLTCPLAEPPQWLVDLLLAGNEQTQRYDGPRHPEFIRVMGGYLAKGLPEQDVRELMWDWNTNIAKPFDKPRFDEEFEKYMRYWRDGRYGNKATKNYLAQADAVSSQSVSPLTPVRLGDFLKQDEKPPEWIADGFIPKQSVVFLGGEAKTGKSWLLMDLAIEIARGGGRWMDLVPVMGGSVLYLDQENPLPLVRDRYRKLLAGKNISDAGHLPCEILSLRNFKFDRQDHYQQLNDLLGRLKPTLFIGDSFIRFHSADENSSTAMAHVNGLIAELVSKHNVTFLFPDHEKKRGKDAFGKPKDGPGDLRGSSEKYAFVDMAFSLTKAEYGGLRLYNTHARWSTEQSPVDVVVEDVTDRITRVRGVR